MDYIARVYLQSRVFIRQLNFDEENEMILTTHAAIRCQQRGIPESIAGLILQIGDTFGAKHGCSIVMARTPLAKVELRNEIKHLGLKPRKGWESAYVIVDQDNVIVTAGHRTKKIKNKI